MRGGGHVPPQTRCACFEAMPRGFDEVEAPRSRWQRVRGLSSVFYGAGGMGAASCDLCTVMVAPPFLLGAPWADHPGE